MSPTPCPDSEERRHLPAMVDFDLRADGGTNRDDKHSDHHGEEQFPKAHCLPSSKTENSGQATLGSVAHNCLPRSAASLPRRFLPFSPMRNFGRKILHDPVRYRRHMGNTSPRPPPNAGGKDLRLPAGTCPTLIEEGLPVECRRLRGRLEALSRGPLPQ